MANRDSLPRKTFITIKTAKPAVAQQVMWISGINVKSNQKEYTRFGGYLKDCKTCPLHGQAPDPKRTTSTVLKRRVTKTTQLW